MSYRPDARTAADVLDELTARAGATLLPGALWTDLERQGTQPPPTWAYLLDGDPTEPSQALLAGLAGVHAGLVEHLDALATRARAALMEQRLGIERLPVVPDRLVVVVDGDPKRTPVVLPKGSLLKAGKTAFGERLYETAETLTVLAAPVLGAHAHRRFPGAADVAARRTPADAPFPAFADATAPAAVHELYLASDLLVFGPGRHELTLTLSGVRVNGVAPALAPVAAVVGALDWRISTAAGEAAVDVTSAAPSGDGVRLQLAFAGATGPLSLGGVPRTYLRAGFPAGAATGFSRETALGLGFGAASLSVHGVDLQPEAAFYNDGLLNVKKEFEPFGPVPRRGDSFLIRLDEAFAKPLARIQITLTRLDLGTGVVGAHYGRSRAISYAQKVNTLIKSRGGDYELSPDVFEDDAFQLRWERHDGDDWTSFLETGSFESVDRTVSVSGPFSRPTTVGGVEGRFVRALLFNGDFGWSSFEETLADNVRKIAGGHGSQVTTVTPPDPPLVSRVRVGYWTTAVTAGAGVDLLARNGLQRPA
ncbi:MAG TPA: hypothetical protein VLN26_15135, partial [Gaiellaceae bacterium]|nr:hypothetical protein [Gaiellaceae bacterium]